MNLQTTSPDPSTSESVQSFRVTDRARIDATVIPADRRDNNFLHRSVYNTTDLADATNVRRTSLSMRGDSVRHVESVKKDRALHGSILEVGDMSIGCEFLVDGRLMKAKLPRDLFDSDPTYGAPVSLELTNEGGFRTPKVTMRSLAVSDSVRRMKAEIDALVDEF